jgi:hypothetical protein
VAGYQVRHLLAAYELGENKLFGHVKPRKTRARFLEFCRYLRSLYPMTRPIAIACDNFSPHLSTRKDGRVGAWAAAGRKTSRPPAVASTVYGLPPIRSASDSVVSPYVVQNFSTALSSICSGRVARAAAAASSIPARRSIFTIS